MEINLETHTLTLVGPLDVDHAERLKEQVLRLLRSPSPQVEVNMAGVTEVDIPILQVLAAGALSAARLGKKWRWRHTPEVVRSKLVMAGLNADFMQGV